MRVFVAGSYSAITEARAAEQDLLQRGHTVTSSWLHEPFDSFTSDWQRRATAEIDRADIERSDVVVILTGKESTSGGFHIELGMALALRLPVYLLGPRPDNIYYLLPDVKDYAEFDPGFYAGAPAFQWGVAAGNYPGMYDEETYGPSR